MFSQLKKKMNARCLYDYRKRVTWYNTQLRADKLVSNTPKYISCWVRVNQVIHVKLNILGSSSSSFERTTALKSIQLLYYPSLLPHGPK